MIMTFNISDWLIRIRRFTFIEKWLILGTLVGALSAILALFFYVLLILVTGVSAWTLGAIDNPLSWNSIDFSIAALNAKNKFLIVTIVILGALLSGLIVYRFEPTAEGPGADAAIRAYHRGIKFSSKIPVVKAIASALLIGCGGSAGVQGPSLQIGAGIGSLLSKFLRLSIEERRLAIVAGMAGALSAIFRSPIGSALFAIEVLYRKDVETEALVPAIISSIVAYTISSCIIGIERPFPSIEVDLRTLFNPYSLIAYVILGLFTACLAFFYIHTYNGVKSFFLKLEKRYLIGRKWLKPVIGASIVGCIGFFMPLTLGSGSTLVAEYILSPVKEGFIGFEVLGFELIASIFILIVLKVIVTAFSIGSGGSGGLFAPAIYIGALSGFLFGKLIGSKITTLPSHIFAYIGMASLFGAATKTPLATSFIVAEMSGNYALIIPALFTSLLASEITGNMTIYEAQIPRRIQPMLAKLSTLLEIVKKHLDIASLKVLDFINESYEVANWNIKCSQALEIMARNRQRFIPVIDDQGKIRGAIDVTVIRKALELGKDTPLLYLEMTNSPIVLADETLHDVIEKMIHQGVDYAIVVDDEEKYLGVVLVEDIAIALATYITKTT